MRDWGRGSSESPRGLHVGLEGARAQSRAESIEREQQRIMTPERLQV